MSKGLLYYKDLDKAMQLSVVSSRIVTIGGGSVGPICTENPRRLAILIGIGQTRDGVLLIQGSDTTIVGSFWMVSSANEAGNMFFSVAEHGAIAKAAMSFKPITQGADIAIVEVIGPPFDLCNEGY